MAKRVIDGTTLSAIADATRNLTGATGVLTPEQITSHLQAEIDSGKVKLETCKVKFLDVEDAGDIYYVTENASFYNLRFTPMWSNSSLTVMKNSIMFFDTDVSTMTVNGNVTKILEGTTGNMYDYAYAIVVTGDCELHMFAN